MRDAPRLAAVSVDLDEVDCYAAIHGLDVALVGEARHAIYTCALPRLLSLFGDLHLQATFFVIGRDALRPESAASLRRAREAGHELGNHSMQHRYDLTKLDVQAQRAEVQKGADAIEEATGARPVGFRAPGYTIDDALFQVLASEGVLYDSSVFPCPAYYAAKASAIGLIRARGSRSHSVVDDPRVLRSPADPYRVGTPYWQPGEGVVELPIGVTRGATLRLPFIGTSVVMGSPGMARWLTRRIVGRPLVSLELHGIDLADARLDGLEWLRPHQPDLRRTAVQKEAALRAALSELRDAGYQFVTCAQAARVFS